MWRIGTIVALHDETATARTITLEVPIAGSRRGQHVDAFDGLGWIPSSRLPIALRRTPKGALN
jgi:hypothetical protein